MEILPGIHCLTVNTTTLPPHRATNAYAVVQGNIALLIDFISPPDGNVPARLAGTGAAEVEAAAITHAHTDHYTGLEELLDGFGGHIACHERARSRLEGVFHQKHLGPALEHDEVIQVGHFHVRVIHTPGHCPDHLCFYLEEEKILFSGDTILGWGTSIIAPPEGDMALYLDTLARLSRLDIRAIFPGHGPLIQDKVNERIKWYIEHRLMRENLVLEALAGGSLTPYEIAERIYSEEDFKMHGRDLLPRAARSVLAHLIKLERENKVQSAGEPGAKTKFSRT